MVLRLSLGRRFHVEPRRVRIGRAPGAVLRVAQSQRIWPVQYAPVLASCRLFMSQSPQLCQCLLFSQS